LKERSIIFAPGNRRERIFTDEKDCRRFLALLGESLGRYEVELHAYVLLPNHFHLPARTIKPNLSRWMRAARRIRGDERCFELRRGGVAVHVDASTRCGCEKERIDRALRQSAKVTTPLPFRCSPAGATFRIPAGLIS